MSVAMWKRSLRIEPTTRNSGVTCQHVFSWQLPDVPWHLHFLLMWSSTTCVKTQTTKRSVRCESRSGQGQGSERRWGWERWSEEDELFLEHKLHLQINIFPVTGCITDCVYHTEVGLVLVPHSKPPFQHSVNDPQCSG